MGADVISQIPDESARTTTTSPTSSTTSMDCCIDTDQLVAVLSHDVSNLASALAGVFEFIINEDLPPDSDELSDFLSMGRHCSKDLLDAVGLIVDLYRLRAGTRTLNRYRFRVEELIDYAIERVSARARDRDIALSHETRSDMVYGDVMLLRRAVVALMVSAIRATPRNGMVRLAASSTSDAGAPSFVVSVTDGAGAHFPDDAAHPLSALLPPPPEGDEPSQGVTLDEVGLAFCELMAIRHGGNAWVYSTEGNGNTLSFAVPLEEQFAENDVD